MRAEVETGREVAEVKGRGCLEEEEEEEEGSEEGLGPGAEGFVSPELGCPFFLEGLWSRQCCWAPLWQIEWDQV